jgi:MoaA/NifB/PqqE/SkfB family radical SAM enzyme
MGVLRELSQTRDFVGSTVRRRGWFLEHLDLCKVINLTVNAAQLATRSTRMLAWPVAVKIDISPLCNLRCTACVHAHPNGNQVLARQSFHKGQMMALDDYRRIIDQIKGKTTAVSLYWLGDPLMHSGLDEMCGFAREAGLNVHISTNLSFALSDERIRRMVRSGLTHLTVCVDGLSQEKYQLTRVGGRIDRVLWNLERVCRFRAEVGQVYPRIEVQYIKFRHNLDELDEAKQLFRSLGVDQVATFWGYLHNYIDLDPGTYTVRGPKRKRLFPYCFWPYASMVIKYNGDVRPCCDYRFGSAYAEGGDRWVLGNVLETSVWEVWRSSVYCELRRLVSNPRLADSESELRRSFCFGCRRLFETDVEKNLRSGADYRFEELYAVGENLVPTRVCEPET